MSRIAASQLRGKQVSNYDLSQDDMCGVLENKYSKIREAHTQVASKSRRSWGILGNPAWDFVRSTAILRMLLPDHPKISSLLLTTKDVGISSISQEEVCLLKRPYWSRIWVIQEIALGKEVHITCGKYSVSWKDLTKTYSKVDFDTDVSIKAVLSGFQAINEIRQERRENPQSDSADSLIELVKQFRHCNAADPRDKIFALLGLLRHSPLSTEYGARDGGADYKKSVFGVYKDFAISQLQEDNLDILSHAGTSAADGKLPSWLPDWSQPLTVSVLAKRRPRKPSSSQGLYSTKDDEALYHAAGKSKYRHRWAYEGNPRVISFRGRIIDTIKPLGNISATSFTLSTISYNTVISTWRKLNACRTQFPDRYSSDNSGKALDFYRTLIADVGPNGRIKEGLPTVLLKWLNGQTILDDDPSLKDILEPWIPCLNNATYGRRYFVTESMYMGLAPADSEPGDHVVVLLGGQVPFVLRPVTEGWKFVGECYVHGIMDGEIMVSALGGDRFRCSTVYKEREFTLV
ncbi:hypothetical protein EG329_000564 [Mollisiaceae sp. DMI_Dod_QoI]|nr:hypothetical protein EG329_000564 [Helotiales sp. DMI_Dod_QoI]